MWGGYLNAELTGQINSFLRRCFKYRFCNAVAKVEQLLEKSDQNIFSAIQNPEHCIHTLLPPSRNSDRFPRPRCHNYQWLPDNYIINRLFPVPFSNTYDDSFLILGIPSVFCVLNFLRVFIVLIQVYILFFYCSVVTMHTRLLCAFIINE